MSCLVNALQGAAQNDETLRLIDAGEWDRFALGLAENAPAVLGDAVQVFKTQAQKNKFAILVAAAASVGLWGANQAAEPVTDVTYKFVFDDGLFGNSKEDSDGEEDDTLTSTETTTSTSTSSCNPEATVNANSVCILFDCQQLSTACASC